MVHEVISGFRNILQEFATANLKQAQSGSFSN